MPQIFLNNFSSSENSGNTQPLNTETENPKEKSSAKKESINQQDVTLCKQVFEKFSPMYVWESKDNEQLVLLLQKILITKPNLQNESELADAFMSLIQKLPEYWKTKKFTIPNLCHNYNEIVSEIRAKNQQTKGKKLIPNYKPIVQKPPEKPKEKTPEEKMKIRIDFIHSVCESYEKYSKTGERGFIPFWVMFDLLVEENVLKITDAQKENYRNQAIAERKEELSKPANLNESRNFKSILENFNSELAKGNEKNKIEIAIKNLAVKGLFDQLKNNQTDIKTLFNY